MNKKNIECGFKCLVCKNLYVYKEVKDLIRGTRKHICDIKNERTNNK